MGRKKLLAGGVSALGAAVLLSATQALAASVTVGTPSSFGPTCYPFSCAGRYGISEYQQVYKATSFPGALSFNQVSFNAAPGYAGDNMDPATYSVRFYLDPTFSTLSTNLASNEGTPLGTFGTFTLGGTLPSTLTLTGATINYDPSQGSLLMDVVITKASTGANPLGYFSGDQSLNPGPTVHSAYIDARGANTLNGGLVTTFSAAVPEPATWAMMLLGLVGLGGTLRSRRKSVGMAAA